MKNKTKISFIITLCVLLSIGFIYIYGDTKEAGSMSDPLVTKSYVDTLVQGLESKIITLQNKMDDMYIEIDNLKNASTDSNGEAAVIDTEQINLYIDEKFAAIDQSGINLTEGFVVVEMQQGEKIIAKESAEIIVRSGTAKAIANEAGDGLSDVTTGSDIKNMVVVEKNHLLIVPRTDGRGLLFDTESYIMIKGNYTIEK